MRNHSINGQTVVIYFVFAILFMACIWAVIHALKPVDTSAYQVITVQSGDTLWEIAQDYQDDISSTSFVNWVEDVNQVRADQIKVGDKLVIPIKRMDSNKKNHIELASNE